MKTTQDINYWKEMSLSILILFIITLIALIIAFNQKDNLQKENQELKDTISFKDKVIDTKIKRIDYLERYINNDTLTYGLWLENTIYPVGTWNWTIYYQYINDCYKNQTICY